MDDKLREAAREAIENLPAETAAGNLDADSDAPGAAFPATDDGADPDE